ncbi:MAG TPA: hypothetical protein VGN12_24310 [Pirellulales bacterium]|jgi:hypothetical protein
MSRWIAFIVTAFLVVAVQQADGEDTPIPAQSAVAETAPTVDFEAILRRPVKVEFADTPLSDVADFFAAKFDINVQLDTKGLADSAVDSAAPVTISLRKPISFASALRLILNDFDLTFVVQNEVLKITSNEIAGEFLTTEVYFVGDLVKTVWPKTPQFYGLMNTISSTIQPDSWDDSGGPGSMEPFHNEFLVIAQTQAVHEELEKLLRDARAQIKAHSTGTEPLGPNEMRPLIYWVPAGSGEQMAAAIRKVFSPATWKENGGCGEIRVVRAAISDGENLHDSLFVLQTEDVHEPLTELLRIWQFRRPLVIGGGSTGSPKDAGATNTPTRENAAPGK